MSLKKIIHQIWCDKYNKLPKEFSLYSNTWKKHHPNWEYYFWTEDKLRLFIHEYFPQYEDIFVKFPFDIQRWDAIRYLILYKIGGLYVDFDYECLKNIEAILLKECCFARDPEEHIFINSHRGFSFNNSLIYAEPGNDFLRFVINNIFSEKQLNIRGKDDTLTVLLTTGFLKLNELYKIYSNKDSIHLIPSQYVSPLSYNDIQNYQECLENFVFNKKINDAYAIHYFSGSWRNCKI